MRQRVLPVAIPSVCPSRSGTVPRRMKIGSHGLHYDVAKTLWFSDTNNGCGQRPLPSEICGQIDAPPLKSADFDQSAYNVSTVRANEKNSIIANMKWITRYR